MKFIQSPKHGPAQKGQILVIFVFALTVLLGFTALAIDGGMIFADRRYSQSVADTAVLAAGGAASAFMEDSAHPVTWKTFTCNNTAVNPGATGAALTAAISRAAANGVTLGSGIVNNQGIIFNLYCQPIPGTRIMNRYLEITVMVTSDVSTNFLHLFYNGPVKNTVTAKIRLKPRTELAFGNAIVSLSNTCGTSGPNQGGITFDGTTNVTINQGGVFSNSCLGANGHVSVTADENAGINYVTTASGGGTLSPPATQVDTQLTVEFDPPTCLSTNYGSSTSGNRTLSPGTYSKITVGNNENVVMLPGLYCLTGPFTVTGGTVNDPARLAAAIALTPEPWPNPANAVTIFMRGTNNTFSVTGGNVYLSAPVDQNKRNNALVSILIYMEDNNVGDVTLVGNSISEYTGIIYAPKQTISVSGAAGENPTFNTQLIGNNVKISGTSNITINYQVSPSNSKAPQLDMTQ